MAPDWAKLKADQKRIDLTLQRNERARSDARAKSERYTHTLTISGAEVQTALSELRKAGLIKK